eukprot:scaffold5787_cov179-Ochromonas_danica.AAC.4
MARAEGIIAMRKDRSLCETDRHAFVDAEAAQHHSRGKAEGGASWREDPSWAPARKSRSSCRKRLITSAE